MTEGLEVLIHVQSAVSLRHKMMHVRRCGHTSLTLALCAQWVGS